MILDEELFEEKVSSQDRQRLKDIVRRFKEGQTDLNTYRGGTTNDVSDYQFLSNNPTLTSLFLQELDAIERDERFQGNNAIRQGIDNARRLLNAGTTSNSSNQNQQQTQATPMGDFSDVIRSLEKKFPYTYRVANALQSTATDITKNTYWVSAMKFYVLSARSSGEKPQQMTLNVIFDNADKSVDGIKDTSLAQLLTAVSEKNLPLQALTDPTNYAEIYAQSGLWDVGGNTLIVIMNLANTQGYAKTSHLYVDSDVYGDYKYKDTDGNEVTVDGVRPLTYDDVKKDNFKDATKIINDARKLGETLDSTSTQTTKRETPYDEGDFKKVAQKINSANPRQVAQDVVDFLSNEPKKEVDKFVANYASKY